MTILRWFMSQTVRNACATHKHFSRLLAAQRDLLLPTAIAAVQLKLDELSAAIREGHSGRMNVKGEELQFAVEKNLRPYPHAAWRENVEVLLVALSVAMAIRTFFLQPFKIPTGSMQPTLFGVSSTPDLTSPMLALEKGYVSEDNQWFHDQFNQAVAVEKAMVIPTGWERIKEYFQGISYVHLVAPVDGQIDDISPMTTFLIFNIKQTITIGGVPQTIWFPPDYGESDLTNRAGLVVGRTFTKGQDVVKLRVTAGDHLFVDRLSYNFCPPARGDTIVFETSGIPEDQRYRWGIPDDEFYIKRLVGLPGEHVQIGDDRHLRINGQRLDASTPHFENVYGFDPKQPPHESQWSGHVNGTIAHQYNLANLDGVPFFPDQNAAVDVPPGDCLPMGDNTCNSLDSRFWGPIPESYVIGRSFFVYWPLTGRFGWGNR